MNSKNIELANAKRKKIEIVSAHKHNHMGYAMRIYTRLRLVFDEH